METIKNYLEAMFANMPNTDDVKKAKNELLQMMEDKYNELIADGHSDNEAVGTVISEFGNFLIISQNILQSTTAFPISVDSICSILHSIPISESLVVNIMPSSLTVISIPSSIGVVVLLTEVRLTVFNPNINFSFSQINFIFEPPFFYI